MKNYIYIVIITFTLFSCSDDFVDVESEDENSEDFFNTEEDYNDALIGAYDLLQSTYLNVMLSEIASDNTVAGGDVNTLDVIGLQDIDKMNHTPVNDELRNIWGWMFAGVNRANYILEFQDKIDFDGKEQILAEARFLRAYYYFELVKFFGGVPLKIDERFLFGDQFGVVKNSKEETYNQIEIDLIAAIDNLPVTQSQIGRVTKGAAQALLGKVYLYHGDFDQTKFNDAADVLETVINDMNYDLVEDYSILFENDNENTIESVFEIQYTDEEGAGFDCLQCSEGNVAVGFNGIRSYNGPDFDPGFGFNLPTQEVVDEFETGDTRLEASIFDIEASGAGFNPSRDQTGYYNRKFLPRKGDRNTGDANLTNPNNYRAIRFSDVLLMAAEALYESGINESRALDYVNRVRARAFGNVDNNLDVSGTDLLNAIYKERRVEFIGEGHHFFDLVRTGRASSEIEGFEINKNEVFPIPSIEIDLTGGSLLQNTGY